MIAAKAVTFKLAGTEAFRERMERTLEGRPDDGGGARRGRGQDQGAMSSPAAPTFTSCSSIWRRAVARPGRRSDGSTSIGISANAIALAYDPLVEPACSGLRFGAMALASRGFGREQFAEVGAILSDALANGGEDPDGSLAGRVAELTSEMPLYRYLA